MSSYPPSSYPIATRSGKLALRKLYHGLYPSLGQGRMRIPERLVTKFTECTSSVSRDVTHPPAQITNTKAKIILVTDGKLDFGTFYSLSRPISILLIEVITILFQPPENPLADDLDVLSGSHQVTVPKCKPGKNYQILGQSSIFFFLSFFYSSLSCRHV